MKINLNISEKIIAPITVNLLTALIVFICVVLFKEPIYELLGPEPAKNYPIYCIAEPYTNSAGMIDADLYIINLTGDLLTERELEKNIIIYKKEDSKTENPNIELIWKKGAGKGSITNIKEDREFNNGKGRIEIGMKDGGSDAWLIRIREIEQKAIIRLKVSTNKKTPGVKRTAKYHTPFEVKYPGE